MIEEAVLIGLASWRVSSLLVNEDGPANVFGRLRSLIGVPETGEIVGVIPSLFSCIWCLSVWIVPVFWAIWEFWAPEPVMIVAAMSIVLAFGEVIEWLGRRP